MTRAVQGMTFHSIAICRATSPQSTVQRRWLLQVLLRRQLINYKPLERRPPVQMRVLRDVSAARQNRCHPRIVLATLRLGYDGKSTAKSGNSNHAGRSLGTLNDRHINTQKGASRT